MNRHIIFLINPISGTKNKDRVKKIIRSKMEAAGISYEIDATEPSGNYDYLKNKIINSTITDVVICGGDGTINKVIGALHELSVRFGIIPLGSGNGLALGVGIPLRAEKSIDIILQANTMSTDAFSVNGKFSCMLSGVGFDAQVAYNFAFKKTRGLLTYIKESISEFFSCKPYPFIIDTGKTRIHTEAFFISIANSNQFGNKVTIAPRASLTDGMLDVVVVNKMAKTKLVFALLWQIAMGKIQYDSEMASKNKVFYFHCSRLKIKNPLKAPLHIDGEPVETEEELDINILPAAFTLMVP